MAVTQYIGPRIVPVFADPVEWSSTKQYEPLTIVTYQGNSFTSRQSVPVGIDINNADFWVQTGNYNAQVEAYRQETLGFVNSIQHKAFAFDTVAEMQESTQLYVGAICHTNGFHSSGDGGAAWYVVSSDGEANGNTIIQCNTYVANLIPQNVMTPEQCGAYGDGVHNDFNALKALLDICRNILINNTYMLDSENTYTRHGGRIFMLDLPSNTHMQGFGTIKYGNNLTSRFVNERGISLFYCNGKYEITNITIDMNAYNNLQHTDSYPFMHALYGRFENTIIHNVRFINSSGRNFVVITGGSNNLISNCTFLNGSTSISGNLQNDFTHLYVASKNTTIRKCYINNELTLNTICGGVEAHAEQITIQGCIINKCDPAIYIVGASAESTKADVCTIIDNIIRSCNRGIEFYLQESISDISIVNNHIECEQLLPSIVHGIGFTVRTDNAVNNLTISENHITTKSRTDRNGCIWLNDTSNATIQGNTLISDDILLRSLGACSNWIVKDNIFKPLDTPNEEVTYLMRVDNGLSGLVFADNENEFSTRFILATTEHISNAKICCYSKDMRPVSHIVLSKFFKTIDTFEYSNFDCKVEFDTIYCWCKKTIGTTSQFVALPFISQNGTVKAFSCMPQGHSLSALTIGGVGGGVQITGNVDNIETYIQMTGKME